MTKRCWDNPLDKAWRAAVRRRDGHKCRRCGNRKRLNCHHIKPWAFFPTLRFFPGNGILLCRGCHDLMHTREGEFAPLCYALLARGRPGAEPRRLPPPEDDSGEA